MLCPVFIDFCTVIIDISTTKPGLIANFLKTSEIDHWKPYWMIKINKSIVVFKSRQKSMFLTTFNNRFNRLSKITMDAMLCAGFRSNKEKCHK